MTIGTSNARIRKDIGHILVFYSIYVQNTLDLWT